MKKRKKKLVCGLDLGAARVGVAVSDESGALAFPRGALAARPRPALLAALEALVRDEGVSRFIVGLPLDARGDEGDAARKITEIAQQIADTTGCDVELWDERLTTVEASRRLAEAEVFGKKAKAHVDETAAVLILQSWLDAQRRPRPGGARGGEE